MPKFATVKLQSTAPYSASRKHDTEKLNRETHEDYETRTWREKSNYDKDGIVFIPAMAFKQALDDVAKMFSTQIPGKGKSTYTKHFKSGVFCMENVSIGIHKDDMNMVAINANSDGVRGSGKRVKRLFPETPSWSADVQFMIADDTITDEVFEKTIKDAGMFIGVGRFRRQNGGMYGSFKVESIEFEEMK